jgi:hypothetical protein
VTYSGGLVFGADGHVFDPTVGRVYYVLDFGGYATIDSFAIAGREASCC